MKFIKVAPADVWCCAIGMALAFALLFYIVFTGSLPGLD